MYELKVGAAKYCVTPPAELFPIPVPEWFGGGEYNGVESDIYVRAIAINDGEKTVLLICAELGCFLNATEIRQRIKNELGVENVIISATHNHEAPEGKINPDIVEDEAVEKREISEKERHIQDITKKNLDYIAEQTFCAARDAIAKMVPAKYGYGEGKSYINVNRDEQCENGAFEMGHNFARPSDKTLAVIKFTDTEGRLIAALLNYPMHNNVCYGSRNEKGELLIFGDMSGECCRFLEERYAADGAVIMWTIGAGGNQNPVLMSGYHKYNPDGTHNYLYYNSGSSIWDACRHLGQQHATDADAVIRGITKLSPCAKLTVGSRMLSLPGTKVEGFTREMIVNSALVDYSSITNEPARPVPLRVALVTLGDIALYSINGEVMCETGMRVKAHSALRKTVIISVADDNPGGKYLVDDWGYEHKTFEYFRNTVAKGEAERNMTEALDDLLEERFQQ